MKVYLLYLRQHRNCGGRGVYASAGLDHGNALNTVAAGFKLQTRVCAVTFNYKTDLLYTAELGFADIGNIYFPAS